VPEKYTRAAWIDTAFVENPADTLAIGRSHFNDVAASLSKAVVGGSVRFEITDFADNGARVVFTADLEDRDTTAPPVAAAEADGVVSVPVPAPVVEGGGLVNVKHALGRDAVVSAVGADGEPRRPRMVLEVDDEHLDVDLPPGVVTVHVHPAPEDEGEAGE